MLTRGSATKATMDEEDITTIGTRNGLELAIQRRTEKTVGKAITQLDSEERIGGVEIEPIQPLADDRGYFAELARLGAPGIAEGMVQDAQTQRRIQASLTLTYPGVIKAIHYHYEQTDLWIPLSGMLQVFLYDFRRRSRTFGWINTLHIGRFRPWRILIPPGVGHGYKTLGTEPAQLLYLTDRFYNPADEGRLAYDHPDIAYDWETQHR